MARKVKKRNKVHGRVQWVDVGEGRFRFELGDGGLRVHRKGRRAESDVVLGFDRLTGGGGYEWRDADGVAVRFAMTADGLEVRRGGSKRAQVVGFAVLSNAARREPFLFADLEAGYGEKRKEETVAGHVFRQELA